MSTATAERAVTLVQDLLCEYKARGLKEQDRFAAVARWLGVTPRRVRAIKNNEAARIADDEYAGMLAGFNRYLDHKSANLAMELKALQARKAAR